MPVTSPLPSSRTFSTPLFQRHWIFGCASALSAIAFEARSVSRRWITVTVDAKRVR